MFCGETILRFLTPVNGGGTTGEPPNRLWSREKDSNRMTIVRITVTTQDALGNSHMTAWGGIVIQYL